MFGRGIATSTILMATYIDKLPNRKERINSKFYIHKLINEDLDTNIPVVQWSNFEPQTYQKGFSEAFKNQLSPFNTKSMVEFVDKLQNMMVKATRDIVALLVTENAFDVEPVNYSKLADCLEKKTEFSLRYKIYEEKNCGFWS